MTPPPLATVTIKEGEDGSTVVLRTDRGAQVHYGPFAEDGVEAAIMHLGSALAMTAMRYQTVLRGGAFGGRLHEQGLQEETPDKRREIAEQLAEAMARDGISRELFADMLEFLGIPLGPTGPPDARLAHLLKTIEEAYPIRRRLARAALRREKYSNPPRAASASVFVTPYSSRPVLASSRARPA